MSKPYGYLRHNLDFSIYNHTNTFCATATSSPSQIYVHCTLWDSDHGLQPTKLACPHMNHADIALLHSTGNRSTSSGEYCSIFYLIFSFFHASLIIYQHLLQGLDISHSSFRCIWVTSHIKDAMNDERYVNISEKEDPPPSGLLQKLYSLTCNKDSLASSQCQFQ